jgi:hypothetical protein
MTPAPPFPPSKKVPGGFSRLDHILMWLLFLLIFLVIGVVTVSQAIEALRMW